MSDEEKINRRQRTQELLANRDAIDSMLSALGAGMSLRDWCVINGVIYSTVQVKLATDEELRPLYEAARMRQAEAVLDEIKELEERLEGVEGRQPIDPKAAAVLIGSKQWRAERLNPKRYGQRSYQEITTVDERKQHLDELRKITAERRARAIPAPQREQPITDAEIIVKPVEGELVTR